MKRLFLLLFFPCVSFAVSCPQVKPISVNKALVQKIARLAPDTSNAHDVEMIIGPACACIPVNPVPSESWVCQWKSDLSSNRLEKTLNITFESGMIAEIVGVTTHRMYLMGEHGKKIRLIK